MSNFKEFVDLDEAYSGYVLSSVMTEVSAWLNDEPVSEGRKDRRKLAGSDFTYKPKVDKTLFGDVEVGEDPAGKLDRFISSEKPGLEKRGGPQVLGPDGQPMKGGDSCAVTPLSGYANHIGAIQAFAKSSPQNFAQVLMFSPLSANVPFAKHWDNYQALMAILKHYYPNKVTRQELEHAVDSFGDKYHALAHSIGGFKLDTIADIWSNKEGLFHELNGLAKGGDDVQIIKRLSQIKGVQPVKAGFIAQLLWGRAGCIDTHNIDIYSKVFPDMDKAGDFEEKQWGRKKGGAEKYVATLDKLKSRGIGTQQLWDVWVDFVETMYVMITSHGKGYYDFQGGALDPKAPEYDALQGKSIPKVGIGKDKGGVMVPLAQGRLGMGASATHLPMDPDDALKQFHQIYRQGKRGSDAARAVAFRTDDRGKRLDQNLGHEPTSLHYFGPAVSGGEVDPEHIKSIIKSRLAGGGGKKARAARQAAMQPDLFGGVA
jgi:hypothetical protein